MPRFFFHVHDGTSRPDQDGTELPNVETVRTEAVHLAADLLHEQARGFSPIMPLSIEVVDEDKVAVFCVEVGLIYCGRPETQDSSRFGSPLT